MLPPSSHEEACKLFVTWLHRLEEMDKENAAKREQSTQPTQEKDSEETEEAQ